MSNGTVTEYVIKNPKVCLLEIFLGISDGLRYLHGQKDPVVHGDLKGVNVLINSRGRPCLCDFGLSRILDTSSLWNTTASRVGGTLRWNAPELLRDQPQAQRMATIESDMYSFGLTCYEVLTGRVPFHQYSDIQILLDASEGNLKLQKPENDSLTMFVWEVLRLCSSFEPSRRPSAGEVYRFLSGHDCQEGDRYLLRCLTRVDNDGDVDSDSYTTAHGDGDDDDSNSDSE